MTAPASARMETVRLEMAGVGSGPQSSTSTPMEQSPEASAVSSMYREPRVLADDDAVPVVAALDQVRDRAPELEHHLAGHRPDVRDAADTVGAEEPAGRLDGFFAQAQCHDECSLGVTQC